MSSPSPHRKTSSLCHGPAVGIEFQAAREEAGGEAVLTAWVDHFKGKWIIFQPLKVWGICEWVLGGPFKEKTLFSRYVLDGFRSSCLLILNNIAWVIFEVCWGKAFVCDQWVAVSDWESCQRDFCKNWGCCWCCCFGCCCWTGWTSGTEFSRFRSHQGPWRFPTNSHLLI